MRRETVRIETYPDRLFLDREEAERYYGFYSGLYSSLNDILPRLKAIRSEYLDWRKPLRAGCLLLVANPASDCLTLVVIAALVYAGIRIYKTSPSGAVVLIVVVPLGLLLVSVLVGMFFTLSAFKVLKTRWNILKMTSKIERLAVPMMLEENILSDATPAESGYRVSGIFEVLSGSGNRLSVGQMVEIWRETDTVTKRIFGPEDAGA